MDNNINHTTCKLITDNPSWDLQPTAMEDQHHHNPIHFHDQYHHEIINPPQKTPLLLPINRPHDPPEEPEDDDEEAEELGAMKEMMFKLAAMQPVDIDPAAIRKPKRRNVRISDDPQSVAARRRRERISERIRILQRLVPGGTKLDTASMLDEAVRYVKFLKRQIRLLNRPSSFADHDSANYSSSSLEHGNWGSFDGYRLLLPDQYCHVHSQGKGSGTAGGSHAGGGFFAAGRGGGC